MTYAMSFTETGPRSDQRLSRFVEKLGAPRPSGNDRLRARRNILALSDDARIHIQMRYRRLRYRHMAG